MIAPIAAWYSRRSAITSSGSALSENPVKPRRSQKSAVISRRWLSSCFSDPEATIRSATCGGRKRRSLPMRSISPTWSATRCSSCWLSLTTSSVLSRNSFNSRVFSMAITAWLAKFCNMMRVGLYRPVHVKTLPSQTLRMLLTHRKLLQAKAIAVENDLRATLRNFGLKVGAVGTVKFEARIKELIDNFPDLVALVEPLLVVRRVLREQISILHRRVLAAVRNDEVCRRLMTVPGVGPVVALTYRATVDVPARFRKSKSVGAVFGLTPARDQSGESDRPGAISRCGDQMMRTTLYEAAQVMLLRSAKWSWLKAWAMKIARHRGMKKAIVALARRLAVIMHRI